MLYFCLENDSIQQHYSHYGSSVVPEKDTVKLFEKKKE